MNIANREPMRLVEHWNQVPNSDVLVLLHDTVRAGLAGIVNEVIRVEAAAAIPELRDPRPNGPRGRVNRDRPGRVELCSCDDVVAPHRCGHLRVCSSPAHVPRP